MNKVSILPVLICVWLIALSNDSRAQFPGSLSNGLVAYYPFSGNANDQTGGGYDGTVIGAQLGLDRFMNPSSAYHFNGSTDYIVASKTLPDSSGFTVSAWIQPATLKQAGIFYDSALFTPGRDTLFRMREDGSLFAAADKIDFPKPGYLESPPVLAVGTWVHVVLTSDIGGMTIYLNGNPIATQPAGGHNIGYHSSIYIGAENHGFYPELFFHGAIDDVAVYNRALTPSEVATLHQSQSPTGDQDADSVNNYREGKDGTDSNDPNSFNPLSKGLILCYQMDGNNLDSSGLSNDLTNSTPGFVFTSDRFGVPSSAAYFTGSDDGADSERYLGITGNNSRTISFWFKATNSGAFFHMGSRIVESYTDRATAFGINAAVAQTNISFHAWGNWADAWTESVAFPQGSAQWRHLAYSYDKTKVADAKLYIDGKRINFTQSDDAELNTVDAPVALGQNFLGPIFARTIAASSLDEFRVYDRALSATEVGQLYQTEAGNLDSDGDGLTDAWENGFGRYQVVQGNFTWDQAKTDAEAKGGHLGTITSAQEHGFIKSNFLGYSDGSERPWLGATDAAQEGIWRWVTGENWSYTRWGNGLPDDGLGGQDYLWSGIPQLGAANQFWDDYGNAWDYSVYQTGYLLEFGYPTDPFKADTDGDGYDDKVETDAKTDPNNPASFPLPPDADGDGIPDASETNTGVYVSPTDTGTDPNNADTDGDGLSDGVETGTGIYVSATNTGTDPNIFDSDGDGLSDGVETNTGAYVSASNTGTNPLNEDTSGDGITDGEAVTAQFNPLVDQRPVLNFLTGAVAAQPNRFGFYNESNVMHLGMGGLMIRKAGSVVNLDLQWQTKTSMTNTWTNFGAPQPFFLNLPGSKAFIRLQAKPGAP